MQLTRKAEHSTAVWRRRRKSDWHRRRPELPVPPSRRLKRLASGRFPVSSPQGPLWLVLIVVGEVNDVESCKRSVAKVSSPDWIYHSSIDTGGRTGNSGRRQCQSDFRLLHHTAVECSAFRVSCTGSRRSTFTFCYTSRPRGPSGCCQRGYTPGGHYDGEGEDGARSQPSCL